ncbi:MAG: hypothetical protein HY720_19405, partial [Planctomycetes bacterium]|nr:hypothetical protein [Planctomycetota bacterium]
MLRPLLLRLARLLRRFRALLRDGPRPAPEVSRPPTCPRSPDALDAAGISREARAFWGDACALRRYRPAIPWRDPWTLPEVEFDRPPGGALACYDLARDAVRLAHDAIVREVGAEHLVAVAAHEYGHPLELPQDPALATEMDCVVRVALDPDLTLPHRHLVVNLFCDAVINTDLHRLDKNRPSRVSALLAALDRGNQTPLWILYVSTLSRVLCEPIGKPRRPASRQDLESLIDLLARAVSPSATRATWLDLLEPFARIIAKYLAPDPLRTDRFGTGRSSAGLGARTGHAGRATRAAAELEEVLDSADANLRGSAPETNPRRSTSRAASGAGGEARDGGSGGKAAGKAGGAKPSRGMTPAGDGRNGEGRNGDGRNG